jgi:hypothetical protein
MFRDPDWKKSARIYTRSRIAASVEANAKLLHKENRDAPLAGSQ